MATLIKLKMKKAEKLQECAKKVYKHSKKLMEFIEDEILDSEEFDERDGMGGGGNFRGGMGGGNFRGGMGGGGNFRDEDEEWDERGDDEEDFDERRGVAGTGRYGMGGSRYSGKRRRY